MAVLCACALIALVAEAARGESVGALRERIEDARSEAGAIAANLQETQARLADAEQEASAATAREEELSSLLASGEERAAGLAAKVRLAEHRLEEAKARLHRARQALAERLVAIYMSGSPSTASVILAASDYDDLAARTEYLQQIEDSDTRLAARVEQVRIGVDRRLETVEGSKARVDAYNERLAVARTQISTVRANAQAAAAELDSVAATRESTLATLKSDIGEWVESIEAAEQASREEAEETVGRWLGGPYSIPTYIVMCESGGNYSALNPSSGAGGAYQVLPSTWASYGGKGNPEDAPKAEQDAIAAQIWSDSGGGAWVCAG